MIGSAPAAGLAGAAPLAAGLGVVDAAGAAEPPVVGLGGTPDGNEGVAGVAPFGGTVAGPGAGRGGCAPATGAVVGARGAAKDGDGERSDSIPLGVPVGFVSVGGAEAAGLGADCAFGGGLFVCVCGAGCTVSGPGVWGLASVCGVV